MFKLFCINKYFATELSFDDYEKALNVARGLGSFYLHIVCVDMKLGKVGLYEPRNDNFKGLS